MPSVLLALFARRFLCWMCSDTRLVSHSLVVVLSRLVQIFSQLPSSRRSGHAPSVSPQAIGSHVIGALLHRAAVYLGHTQVNKAVIAVPAKFDARQRAATVEAFRMAGLQVCITLRSHQHGVQTTLLKKAPVPWIDVTPTIHSKPDSKSMTS